MFSPLALLVSALAVAPTPVFAVEGNLFLLDATRAAHAGPWERRGPGLCQAAVVSPNIESKKIVLTPMSAVGEPIACRVVGGMCMVADSSNVDEGGDEVGPIASSTVEEICACAGAKTPRGPFLRLACPKTFARAVHGDPSVAVAPLLAWSGEAPATWRLTPGIPRAAQATVAENCGRQLQKTSRWQDMVCQTHAQGASRAAEGVIDIPRERLLAGTAWRIGGREITLAGVVVDVGSGAASPLDLDAPGPDGAHRCLWGLFDVSAGPPTPLHVVERSWPVPEADAMVALAETASRELLVLTDERRPTATAYEKRAVLRTAAGKTVFDVPYGTFCPEDRD